jgi:hypothetical protein
MNGGWHADMEKLENTFFKSCFSVKQSFRLGIQIWPPSFRLRIQICSIYFRLRIQIWPPSLRLGIQSCSLYFMLGIQICSLYLGIQICSLSFRLGIQICSLSFSLGIKICPPFLGYEYRYSHFLLG